MIIMRAKLMIIMVKATITIMTKTNQGSGEDKEAHWKHRNAKDD